jgi:hypothetical protein
MKPTLGTSLAFAVYSLCTVSAATFSTDFNSGDVPGLTVSGSAQIAPDGGVGNSGVLKLTTADIAQTGSAVLDDLDGGQAISAFTATFKVLIGGPSASPAFGFSFVYGPNVSGTFGVDGAGDGLRLVFETFDRGNGRAPTIDVWFANRLIASHKVPNLRTGTRFVDCMVRINEGGALDLDYDGQPIYRNLFCFIPVPGNFGFGAATGGIADNHWIDDLNITTTEATESFISLAQPDYTGARPDPLIDIAIVDNAGEIDGSKITMKFNDAPVTPQFLPGDVTGHVQYEPPGLLPPGSLNHIELTYVDKAGATHTIKYDFVVTQYPTLPASFAVAPGVVNTSSSGFKVRVNQVAPNQLNTIDRAERQIAGQLVDASGQPLPNIADLTGAVNGVFDIPGVVNWDQDPSGAGSGFIVPDEKMPGIPGTQGTDDNIAIEAITYLDLQPGAYTFGVFADDGYKLTTGANPQDAFAFQLGAVDSGKGPTTFSFAVTQAGIYPFRLLYYEGQGAAGVEWFAINKLGERILINDRNNAGAIKAYSEVSATRAFVRSVSPKPGETGVAPTANIQVSIQEGSVSIDPASVQLFFNGQKVNPIVGKTKPAGPAAVTVFYDPLGRLKSESVNTVKLSYAEGANVVEHEWSFTVIKSLSENAPRKQDSGPDGLLVLEAEDADANISAGGTDWTFTTEQTGFSGTGAMCSCPNTGRNVNIDTTQAPHLDFKVEFVKTGTHYIWIRGYGDSPPGASANDSVNIGIDGTLPATSDRIGNGWVADNGFIWANVTFEDPPARFEVTTLGEHQINVWMREDGFIMDKILITSNPDFVPGDPLTEIGPPETPRDEPPAPFQQDSGPDHLIVLEAEHAHANTAAGGTSWVLTTDNPGFAGEGALCSCPNTGRNVNIDTTQAPHLDFTVEFVATGTHYIWVRGLGDSPPGASADDSVNVGIDGTLPATSDRIGNGWVAENGFVWANVTFEDPPARFEVTTLGEHQINLWMREDGFIVDRILLTTNPDFTPADPLTEIGPAESKRATVITVEPATLSIKVKSTGLEISWSSSGKLQSADKVNGPWTETTTQTNPQIVTPTGVKFYRVVGQAQ